MNQIGWPLVQNIIRRKKKSNTYGRFKERKSGVHWGWDFYAKVGTPCYAIADGVIADVYGGQNDTKNFGLVVVLEFEFEGKKLYAAYCHLNSSAVLKKTSDNPALVTKGQLIGHTGNSGNAFNMSKEDEHLHFELRTSSKPVPGGHPFRLDPIQIFKKCPLDFVISEP